MKKDTGYSVSVTTKAKRGNYIQGYLSKVQALKLAMQLATGSNQIEIDKCWQTIDKYGEIEEHSRPYGVMKKVKRKSGYAYVIQTYDSYGWDSWKYDVTPDGLLRHRRE